MLGDLIIKGGNCGRGDGNVPCVYPPRGLRVAECRLDSGVPRRLQGDAVCEGDGDSPEAGYDDDDEHKVGGSPGPFEGEDFEIE